MTVICKENGQRLLVLSVTEMNDGRPAYVVCKETAGNSQMGQFKIAQDAVEQDFK